MNKHLILETFGGYYNLVTNEDDGETMVFGSYEEALHFAIENCQDCQIIEVAE